uniref:NADP-dependent oxidoreductase domain-containing protein n=1 Tax=Aegilops tauschii subsp. strangulata TaxID=200361 RepID=A0A453E072_AEGTS
ARKRTGAARSSSAGGCVPGGSPATAWCSPPRVAGPSGQMTWIRGGPVALDSRNITEAIDSSLRRLGVDYIDLYQIHWPDRYVPMFGETDYDPSRQYASIPMEEQLEALGKGVESGKVCCSVLCRRCSILPICPRC